MSIMARPALQSPPTISLAVVSFFFGVLFTGVPKFHAGRKKKTREMHQRQKTAKKIGSWRGIKGRRHEIYGGRFLPRCDRWNEAETNQKIKWNKRRLNHKTSGRRVCVCLCSRRCWRLFTTATKGTVNFIGNLFLYICSRVKINWRKREREKGKT